MSAPYNFSSGAVRGCEMWQTEMLFATLYPEACPAKRRERMNGDPETTPPEPDYPVPQPEPPVPLPPDYPVPKPGDLPDYPVPEPEKPPPGPDEPWLQ
jgi:hypothetical protein